MAGLTACFTGHRPQHFPFRFDENDPRCEAIKDKLWESIKYAYNNGVRTFISGMALGVDQWAAELVIEFKKLYDVQLWAAIPCLHQENRWSQESKDRYFRILKQCDKNTIVSNCDYNYECMQLRNEWMVDRSDMLLAVYQHTKGGTQNCILYAQAAQRVGKQIQILNVLEDFEGVI